MQTNNFNYFDNSRINDWSWIIKTLRKKNIYIYHVTKKFIYETIKVFSKGFRWQQEAKRRDKQLGTASNRSLFVYFRRDSLNKPESEGLRVANVGSRQTYQ